MFQGRRECHTCSLGMWNYPLYLGPIFWWSSKWFSTSCIFFGPGKSNHGNWNYLQWWRGWFGSEGTSSDVMNRASQLGKCSKLLQLCSQNSRKSKLWRSNVWRVTGSWTRRSRSEIASGQCWLGFQRKITMPSSVEVVESLAARRAAQFARELGFDQAIFWGGFRSGFQSFFWRERWSLAHCEIL